MEPDTYTCAACGETFINGWSDEEQRAEAGELFGHVPEADCAVVCDDCFQAMERQRVAKGIPLEAFRDGRDPFKPA